MEHHIRNLIRIKEKDLATPDKPTSEIRSPLECARPAFEDQAAAANCRTGGPVGRRDHA